MNFQAETYWVDGRCDPDTHRCRGSAFDGETIWRFKLYAARNSVEAEYDTLILLLQNLPDRLAPTIYSDCKMLVDQMANSTFRVHGVEMKRRNLQARTEMTRTRAKLLWLPRVEIEKRLGH